MSKLKEALALIEKNSSRAYLAGPKPPELVRKAEAALGLEFPPSYREFVSKVGCGSVAGCEIYGVTTDNFETASIPNGIWLTLDERRSSGLPDHLILVYSVGDGAYYALNTAQRDACDESPVVVWPIGAKPQDKLELVAENFGEFLLERVSDALADS